MKRLSALAVAFLSLTAAASSVAAPRKVMNIVNFVRALDPRGSHADYVAVLEAEVALNNKYDFPNTILFQYDALIDPAMRAAAAGADKTKTEFGLWFEMSKPLVDAAGIPWRPKHGDDWQWDWFINPGFLMAYTPAQREKLIDVAFAKFKEYYGVYPKVAGSWLIDAHSMDYMVRTYAVDGFCICREQDNTDAYGLRGGYSNGAYYPSKMNMLSAATKPEAAIGAPVFKMLTPDPIYNYADPKTMYADYPFHWGCPTMEPVWETGFLPDTVDWFFRVYIDSPGLVNLSYMQAGQENSFGLAAIMKGLPLQMEHIAALRKAGKLEVETFGDTARRFKADHPGNVPQTQVALEDWSNRGRKSVWYNAKYYRANLFFERGRLYFRDMHKMCDDYPEPFRETACTGWQAEYFTPPFVDAYLHRSTNAVDGIDGMMAFDGTFISLDVQSEADDKLVVTVVRTNGVPAKIVFSERSVAVTGAKLDWAFKASDFAAEPVEPATARRAGRFACTFRGYKYTVGFKGACVRTEKGYRFEPMSGDESVSFCFAGPAR